jgi:hypothetical protein
VSPGGIDDTITGNAVGIYSYSTQVTVGRNDISGNTHYGIQSLHSPNASVTRNVLGWNGSGGADAAIYNDHSDQSVVNNVIGWNNGSGIYNSWSNPIITNNTIALNLGGSGIANFTSSPVVANNIVSGNGVYGIHADPSSAPVNSYNDVWLIGWGDWDTPAGPVQLRQSHVVSLWTPTCCNSPAIAPGITRASV